MSIGTNLGEVAEALGIPTRMGLQEAVRRNQNTPWGQTKPCERCGKRSDTTLGGALIYRYGLCLLCLGNAKGRKP